MYPVTKAVAEQFKTNARQNLSLLVNPVVGESFELTSADILSAGLNINRYSATGDSVALGVCSAADLSLRVENGDGRFNDVVFEGAQIYASVGVEDGNNTQWVPLGYFTVDNAPRRLAVISITALDGMVQFDKLANRSALSLPNSVKNIVLACCNECNITIDTDLDSLPNSGFVAQSVGDAEDLTYRTILQWCCQIMGVNGYMDWDGHLELSWYKKDGIPETVSGSIATFESVTNVPVSHLIVNVEPYQNLNGYDHPWVGGAGKNLVPPVSATTTIKGITWTLQSDGTIKATGTTTATSALNWNIEGHMEVGESYVLSGSPSGGSGTTYEVMIISAPGGGGLVREYGSGVTINSWLDTYKYIQLAVRHPQSNVNLTFKPMICKSTATNPTVYEPYENICPIYPGNGKNLLPQFTSGTSSGLTYTVNDDGSVHVIGTNTGTAVYAVRFTLNKGDYILSGAPKDGQLTIRNAVGGSAPSSEFSGRFDDYGSEARFSVSATASAWLNIRSVAGTWDTTYYPMIRPAEITDPSYVPYKAIGTTRTGKNLLSQNSIFKGLLADANLAIGNNTSTVYRTAIIKLPQGSWTFTFPVNVLLTRLVKDGTYSVISNSNINTYTINTTTDGWVGLSWRDNTSSSTNWNDSSVTQLEKGSASTGIEPYTAEHYYSQGAEYLTNNPSDWTTSTCSTSGYANSTTRVAPTAWTIPFKEGHTYTVDMEGSYESKVFNCGVNEYGSSGTRTKDFGWKTMPFTFTVSSGTAALRITFRASDDSSSANYINAIGTQIKFKMTENGVPSPVVPFGKDVYGGTLDVVSGVLTVNKTAIDMGSITWTYYTGASAPMFYGDLPNGKNNNTNGGQAYIDVCSCYKKAYSTVSRTSTFATNGTDGSFAQNTNTQCRMLIKDSRYSNGSDFKTAVTGQTVVYELENPLTYQLTPNQVELLKGTNNIWADNSTLSVTFPAVTEITPADRYNSDIYENAVTITGVSVKGKENQSVVGSEDYALAIDGNPLFTDDDVETIANGLIGLIGFSYHPFSASVLPMPYLYPLDMVAVQYKDEWYDCAITEINFTSTAPTQLKGTGESAQSRSYARINPLTNRERAIIENLKDEMNTTLNKAVNNIIDFNNIISNALGLYHTNVSDGAGGFIRYLHDAPDLESSTYIVTETAQGFAWTTNGWNGGTPVWQYGVTSGGYALFKWLSAEGIDVTRASSDYRAEVTPEHFNIYYKSDLIITIDATDRAIQTPRMVIPYSSTSNNSLRVGQLVWLPTTNGANAVVLGS